MNIQKVGMFTWMINKSNTKLLINSQLGTKLNSNFDGDFLYENKNIEPINIQNDSDKSLCIIQLSDQFQYFNPKNIYKLKPNKIVTHKNCVVNNFLSINIDKVDYNEWHIEGDLEYLIFPTNYGDYFWDNSGASIFIRDIETNKTIFIQGNNTISKNNIDIFPKSVNLSILSFNSYSTVNETSSYFNSYDDGEYFDKIDDLKLLMHIVDSTIPSEKILFQGVDFTKNTGVLSRNRISYYNNLLSPYLLGTELINIDVGEFIDFGSNTYTELKFEENHSINYSSKIIKEEKTNHLEMNFFLDRLSEIILLTGFGKEIFGCSNINKKPLSEHRFCISFKKDESILIVYTFNIASNSFEIFEHKKINSLKTFFPFGVEIDLSCFVKILNGDAIFWDLANSKYFSQWYLGNPKNSPVTLLFIYFQEACNIELLSYFWNKS